MSDTSARLTAALADRYRVERELGAGGMATVYLAHDLRHERDVAIKVLHPDLGAALGAERFLGEIKTTAKLQHPHILPLLDSGSADGLLFYVMPYVRGETLRDRLTRETQLPVADALRIAREVADALTTAHEAGVVHRDIKPENILLQGGHALVADFGIALAVQQAGGARMTQTGLSLGTPQYMSPEQAMGDKSVDHRADQYALAAVTYEMLASEPPHTGTNPQAIVAKLLTETVRPVTVLRPAVPAHVDAALQVALQKLPADRFPSVAEFSAALQGTATGHTQMTGAAVRTAPSRGVNRGVALLVGLVLVAAGATGGWMLGSTSSMGPSSDALPAMEIPLESPPDLNDVANGFYSLDISSDGTQIAFSASDSLGDALFIRRLTDGTISRITSDPVAGAVFSPNGERLAYYNIRRGTVELSDGNPTNFPVSVSRGGNRGLAWTNDSTLILSAGRAIYRLHLAENRTDTLIAPNDTGRLYRLRGRLGGTHVLAISETLGDQEGDVVAISTVDGSVSTVGTRGNAAMMAPNDWLVTRSDRTLYAQRLNRRTMKLEGSRRVLLAAGSGGRLFAISDNGILVASRALSGLERELVVVTRDGVARPVLAEPRGYLSPRFSPDGRRISFTLTPRASVGGDAWVADIASGTLSRITTDSANTSPEWSADGQSLIIARLPRAGGAPGLDRIPASGGAAIRLLTRTRPVYESQWSSDGRTVIWREDTPGTGRDIYTMRDGDTTSIRALHATAFDERGLAMAPDGNLYAFVSDESGRDEVYVARLDQPGPRWPVTSAGGIEPRWAKNGELFYRQRDSVYVTRVTPGDAAPAIAPPRAIVGGAYVTQGFEPRWDVSPDGQRFAMVRLPSSGASLQLSIHLGWLAALENGTIP